jgi:hypothetical protein
MDFLESLNHLANLFLLPLMLAAFVSGGAKVLWRRELQAQPWVVLFAAAAAAGCAIALVGLGLSGHDGRMGTYLALVIGIAVVVWWMGFVAVRRS